MKAATKKKIGIAALITAVVATIVVVTRAKAAPGINTLWGYVTDAIGNSISNARFKIGNMAVVSGIDGGYEIPNIPVTETPTGIYGVYDVTISAVGYETQVHRISVVPGDANCDGVIDDADVEFVKDIIFGIEPSTPSADAQQDGLIDTGDVIKIRRIIAGYDEPLTTERFDVQLESAP